MNWINEIGGYIMNGTAEGGKEEFTYIEAKGCTVINYNIVNEICNNRVKNFRIDNRIESDHLPLILTIDCDEKDEERRRNKKQKWN